MIIRVISFTSTPGGRYRSDGEYSGQEFREKYIEPYMESTPAEESLEIDLDGVEGYATAFLEEVFGGLVRKYGKDIVERKIRVISSDEPMLIKEAEYYINNATKSK